MPMTDAPANLSVQGGTAQQRSAVAAAHASATAALRSAQAKSAQGGDLFSTWFGAATQEAVQVVSGSYGLAADLLESAWIAYELDARKLGAEVFPGVWVGFEPSSARGAPVSIEAAVWTGAWEAMALDPSTTAARLVQSVVHEALAVATTGKVVDLVVATDPEAALRLAATSPTSALISAHNYMGYAAALGASVSAASPAPVTARAAAAPPRAAAITRYGDDGTTAVKLVECDFSGLRYMPTGEMAGGTLALESLTPTRRRTSATKVDLAHGGRPVSATTMKYGTDGEPTATVATDYTDLRLGEGNRLDGGALATVTRSPTGVVRSNSREEFDADGNPATIATHRYDEVGNEVVSRSLVDYSAAEFDVDHRITRGTVAVSVRRADSTLRSRSEVAYSDGGRVRTTTWTYGADGATLLYEATVHHVGEGDLRAGTVEVADFREAKVDGRGRVHLGTVVTRVRKPTGALFREAREEVAGDGSSVKVVKHFGPGGHPVVGETIETRRSDGTLATRRIAAFGAGGQLEAVESFEYDPAGVAVVAHGQDDFSVAKLGSENELLGGTVRTDELRGDGTSKARVAVDFGTGGHEDELRAEPRSGGENGDI